VCSFVQELHYTSLHFIYPAVQNTNAMGTMGGSVDEWLACWTQAQKGLVHCASVHQAAKLVAALLRVAGVTAGMAESNGSLPSGS